jgi:hypothetical protein
VKNISLSIFSLDGGPKLAIEPSNNEGRIRLIVKDTADRERPGRDVIFSCPIEQEADLANAIAAFNRIMRFCEVTG